MLARRLSRHAPRVEDRLLCFATKQFSLAVEEMVKMGEAVENKKELNDQRDNKRRAKSRGDSTVKNKVVG